ncbi:MAG: hypothetical protein A2Z16_11360 [Chloroflexi bacterium RBG_16_54_18]|nr:MAG: hypothetical protein A2Z16_11360 [Chloroflexi bacterium RBG_16_54_18]
MPAYEANIFRLLHLEGDLDFYQPINFFLKWKGHHRENLMSLERTIKIFNPDLLFVWGMWALSKSIPALAEQLMPGRVVYYLSDYWPCAIDMHTTYWKSPARRWPMRVPKRVLSKIAMSMLAKEGQPGLDLERVVCVSARVRELLVEAGLPIENARIIHGGTDVARFTNGHKRVDLSENAKLLYAGQLVQHKGVHTAIEAMDKLVNSYRLNQIHLTLVGSGHPEYVALLRDLVNKKHLQDYVTFHKPVTKDNMPAILQQYQILVFPSIYEEPLARVVQEAMASGLVVVGTNTGGTKEILVDGENGLTFQPEDADGLAKQICRLIDNPELSAHLAKAGRHTVVAKFTLNRMVNEVDSYLLECLAENSIE